MYSRQHRTSKSNSNDSETPASNQFAPRPFVVQPQVAEPTTQQNQTADLQAEEGKTKEVSDGFPDSSVFTRHVAPPKQPKIQMKLTIGKPGDKYEQEADKMAADVVQQNGEVMPRSYPLEDGNVPSLSPQLHNGAKMIQRLLYKSDNTPVDINSLSFARVLDYLKRPDPDPDSGGVIFETDDKSALLARSNQLYPLEFQKLQNFLGQSEVATNKTSRNIPASVNLQQILTDMETRYNNGNLPGFREWLASVNVNLNALNVLDKINELRAAQNITGLVNIDETPIAGTNQTADLTHGNSQTEVKTIRQPIQGYQDFTGQVTAALGKFANVNPMDGNIYNATIYGSIDQDLISGKTTHKKGFSNLIRINPTNLDKITTVTRLSDGQQLNQMTENQLDKLLDNLNTQNWNGANLTHNIYIVLENGTQQQLVRNMATNQWSRV